MQLMKIRSKIKTKKGFSLIEFVISMAIFAIMLMLCTNVIVRLTRLGEEADTRAEINRNVTFALETMKRYTRTAKSTDISICATGATPQSCVNIGNVKFQLEANTNNTKKITQTITGSTTTVSDLTTKDIDVDSLSFDYSQGYLEIILKLYDINHVIYKDTSPSDKHPYVIVSGALTRS